MLYFTLSLKIVYPFIAFDMLEENSYALDDRQVLSYSLEDIFASYYSYLHR